MKTKAATTITVSLYPGHLEWLTRREKQFKISASRILRILLEADFELKLVNLYLEPNYQRRAVPENPKQANSCADREDNGKCPPSKQRERAPRGPARAGKSRQSHRRQAADL